MRMDMPCDLVEVRDRVEAGLQAMGKQRTGSDGSSVMIEGLVSHT